MRVFSCDLCGKMVKDVNDKEVNVVTFAHANVDEDDECRTDALDNNLPKSSEQECGNSRYHICKKCLGRISGQLFTIRNEAIACGKYKEESE